MKNISIIVAIAQNLAIGKENQLLWHISDDLKRFKTITQGHAVVMGRLTYESLPFKPLPKRRNIVISSSAKIDGCEMASSLEEALKIVQNEEEVFVIGGGSIYKQCLPYANKLYLTIVEKNFDADTFFPQINVDDWETVDESENFLDEKSQLPYKFKTLIRK